MANRFHLKSPLQSISDSQEHSLIETNSEAPSPCSKRHCHDQLTMSSRAQDWEDAAHWPVSSHSNHSLLSPLGRSVHSKCHRNHAFPFLERSVPPKMCLILSLQLSYLLWMCVWDTDHWRGGSGISWDIHQFQAHSTSDALLHLCLL